MFNASAYYPSAKVDGLFKAASGMMWTLTEELDRVQQENEELRKQASRYKAAATGKVVLEKVASPAASMDRTKVDEFVDTLVGHAIIDERHREKFAAACLEDANAALILATQAIRSSESPAAQGQGYIAKAAKRGGISESDRLKSEEEEIYRRWQ